MEFFTILLKENSNDNMKLLTDKLNDGFHIEQYISVGRSTTVVLRKRVQETRISRSVPMMFDNDYGIATEAPTLSGSY